jgi:ubiquinone/menaquinone biosynthesis C-methylase UbiE
MDFGYPWWLSYGHLVVAAVALMVLVVARRRKLAAIVAGLVLAWSVAGFAIARFGLNVNGRMEMPTQNFLAAGQGRVLDMGAGTGRSTLMVLEARPGVRVVALDLFGDSYEHHFGPGAPGKERLLTNLRHAGVDGRASIEAGDMRKLPFEPGSFDAVVSTYAIDHLSRDGIKQALGEAARVLRPGGEFLMAVLHKDGWMQFAFGPLLLHSGTRGEAWWRGQLQEAGFEVVEQGTSPGTLFFMTRKPG